MANIIARTIVFAVTPAMSASAGAIHRAAAIYRTVDAVSSDANSGLNADAPRTHADARSNTDTGCTRASARQDSDAARAHAGSRLPDTALRRAVCVAVNRGLSR